MRDSFPVDYPVSHQNNLDRPYLTKIDDIAIKRLEPSWRQIQSDLSSSAVIRVALSPRFHMPEARGEEGSVGM